MDTSLELISKIDQIYSNALTRILIITGFMVTFTGVITPVVVGLYSRRLHKLDEAESHRKIEDATKAALAELQAEFDRYCKASDARLAAAVSELQEKQKAESGRSFGATLHLQGDQQYQEKKYGASVVSYLEAAGKYLGSGDYYNLGVIKIFV
jgi:tRNA(Ser,Leu) C12 N-acetylase TAN1